MALVVFFCASSYDLDAIADEMRRCFAGVQVSRLHVGRRDRPRRLSRAQPRRGDFRCPRFHRRIRLHHRAAGFRRRRRPGSPVICRAGSTRPPAASRRANRFALLLIDGLSVREEAVTRHPGALGVTPLVGGSAADGSDLGRTLVCADGQFHNDAAVLTLVATSLPFRLFDTHHFEPTDERLVVTSADPAPRRARSTGSRRPRNLPASRRSQAALTPNISPACR